MLHSVAERGAGAIVFHRPNRLFSAVRDGNHKLMLFWKRNGSVDHHELYDVDTNPTEEGNDIASEDPETAKALKSTLMKYLKEVNADKPQRAKKK